jgi:hypothetical protein
VPESNGLLLTFDQAVRVDDVGSEIEGFSNADESGVFYIANAIAKRVKERELQNKQLFVTSPFVIQPVAVRYAWSRAPMGNLKVDGIPCNLCRVFVRIKSIFHLKYHTWIRMGKNMPKQSRH